uniref:Cleavage and polyadenylation specificity factor subunit 4 n=1 Tax=Junco hyemalis TaxID=40217 RepID=A0A8C5IDD5_JUNHY
MQELVAGVERISLDSEADVEQLRAQPLPFLGVDSKLGTGLWAVPGVQGHPRPGRTKPTVCKHWLRGLCKRGESCDFLHGYDASRVPECCFYSRFGECSNKDCPFLHAGATASTGRCPWYDRGFCWHVSPLRNSGHCGHYHFLLFLAFVHTRYKSSCSSRLLPPLPGPIGIPVPSRSSSHRAQTHTSISGPGAGWEHPCDPWRVKHLGWNHPSIHPSEGWGASTCHGTGRLLVCRKKLFCPQNSQEAGAAHSPRPPPCSRAKFFLMGKSSLS